MNMSNGFRTVLAISVGVALLTAGAAHAVPFAAMLVSAYDGPSMVIVRSIGPAHLDYELSGGAEGRIEGDGLDTVMLIRGELGVDVETGVGAMLRASFSTAVARRVTGALGDAVLRLTDGQRLPGRPVIDADDADAIRWRHPELGVIRVPLERVAAVGPGASVGVLGAARLSDRLVLRNGDELTGFLASAGDPILFERDTDGAPVVEVPWERVDRVEFANPAETPQGQRVWLDDGTAIAPDDLVAWRDLFEQPAGVVAVAWSTESIVPLASLEPIEQTPVSLPRRSPVVAARHRDDATLPGPPPLGLRDLTLAGPQRLTYDLPPDALRLLATAVMPSTSLPSGACELVIRQGGDDLFTVTLGPDQRSAPIDVQVAGGPLTFELREGERGPVQDIVELRRPCVIRADD
ncbi:MAG: hypothetical protein AAGI30_05105 [Planctomycetota bacterium]